MARKIADLPESASPGESEVFDPQALLGDWFEFQGEWLANALGQIAGVQQAAWASWFEFMNGWSPVALDPSLASPWSLLGERGGEQLG